jgi:AbrB family looped-hinge helix DNA binding protein
MIYEIATFAVSYRMAYHEEDQDMSLMRVRAASQLTLPADVRKALNIKEGDYLEAEIVKDGVLLKPVSVVARAQQRQEAWKGIAEAASRVKNLKPRMQKSVRDEEEWIASQVVKSRPKRRKHA